jgi:hypothetical protein
VDLVLLSIDQLIEGQINFGEDPNGFAEDYII